MKIRTQFIINIIVLGSILVFVSGAVVVTNQWVENTHQQQELAAQIEREAYELGYLANDYLLYRESQQASRWESKFTSFSEHLSKVDVDAPEHQALLANMRNNEQQLKTVFEDIRARIETAPQTPESGFDIKFMQLSWGRLEVQNQGMIFNASRLEGVLNEQEHGLEQMARLLSLVLIGILGIFLLVNYRLTFRRILQAIGGLQAGTRIIGSGNLDFAIDVKSDDEIGELSHAFNQMTGQLRTITASRAELEREIAERKRAQDALRKSEQKFYVIFEKSPFAGTLSRLPNGVIVNINEEFERVFGYTKEEVIGRTSLELGINPDSDGRARLTAELQARGSVRNQELTLVTRSGVPRLFLLNIDVVEIGEEKYILQTAQDITERKQIEEELRESEQRLNRAQEIDHLGSWELDLVNNHLTWSDEVYRIFGLHPQEFGATYEAFLGAIHPGDRAAVDDAYSGSIREGRDSYEIEHRVVRRSTGEIRIVHEKCEHARGPDGQIIRSIGMVHDVTERKRAEQALLESEEKYRLLANHANDWIYWIKPDMSFQYISPSCEQLTGFTPLEFIDNPQLFIDIIHPEDRTRIEAHLGEVREGDETHDLDYRIVTKASQVRWISHSCEPVYAEDGKYMGRSGTNRDITERKQAENLIQARMRLMEYAATHSLEEILQQTLDEVGKITSSPIGFYHFVEADQQTLSLQTWSTRTLQEFCTAQGKGLHYNVSDAGVWVESVLQRRPVIHNDYASLPNRKGLPEGHAQVIRELVVPILRGDRIVSILGVGNKPSNYTEKDVELVSYLADVAWEIADRKRAEEEITRLSKFPTENPNPILRVQNDGKLIYANAASQELLEVWHCEVNDYLPPELSDLITAAVRDRLNKTVDVPCNDKVYSIMLVPIVESGYVNIYGRDITERKRAEEALKLLAEDLHRSNAELEQFAYVASHDLQEPLRMVSSYMQLLSKRYQGRLDEDADEFIGFAVDGAKRMQNLINDLLTYSRVGTRGKPLVPTSCEEAIEEAQSNLQIAIEESNATITHETLPQIDGDPTQLVQLFQNLLSNAIKFRGRAPLCIHVGVARENAEWIFSVRDNGIGIDPKFAERIFVIFQRLHDRESYPGTGIGLAICKRIVQRHGGRIWVESEPGRGATFYFTLPSKETL